MDNKLAYVIIGGVGKWAEFNHILCSQEGEFEEQEMFACECECAGEDSTKNGGSLLELSWNG